MLEHGQEYPPVGASLSVASLQSYPRSTTWVWASPLCYLFHRSALGVKSYDTPQMSRPPWHLEIVEEIPFRCFRRPTKHRECYIKPGSRQSESESKQDETYELQATCNIHICAWTSDWIHRLWSLEKTRISKESMVQAGQILCTIAEHIRD